jgi:phosphoglucosamine mutase
MGEKYGIHIEATKVGDRYVLEKMLKKGHCFGGEQSGHLIFLDHNTTGDGILSAVQLAAIVKKTGKTVAGLNRYMELLPQVLRNASVLNEKKYGYLENELLVAEIEKLEKHFEGRGRVLIRPSGTEPLVRVMIEGKDIEEITAQAERLAKLLEEQLT